MIVAVVVYDRFQNVKEWVRCWNLCDQNDAQLIIIHNYANEDEREAYRKFCDEAGVYYVPRRNIGMDIGAFQDVCRGRLEGFPNEWDYILWCTDDTLPMSRDMIDQFKRHIVQPNVGIACMEMSREVRLHVRTTGFMISQETASKLQFPADTIKTKWECYLFEHKSTNNMLDQIVRMGKKVSQIAPLDKSPLWDSGKTKKLPRQVEHYKTFPTQAQSDLKVTVICPVFNSYPDIISSCINQTHKNWELLLIHDGPCITNLKEIVEAANDKRINYFETKNRSANWGHKIRQWALELIREERLAPDSNYIVITNADNHHVPTYMEYMLGGFFDPSTVATYCSQMVHSYVAHKVINCSLQQGYLDCAGVMVRRDVACEIGWQDVDAHSSDWLYFKDIMDKYGRDKFEKVEGCLLVHN